MAVLVSDQIHRIQMLLQDTDAASVPRPQILQQHQDEITRLAREQRAGDIPIIRGMAGQALYTLPVQTVQIHQILYNGQRLDYATEESLDRLTPAWEWKDGTEPRYWTTNNQNPNTFRVSPPPRRTGSNAPVIPPAPFVMTPIDNFVLFLTRDFSDVANDETDTFPLMDLWEDVAVWRTVTDIARRENPYQNMPLSQIAQAFGELWLSLIEGA